MSPLWLQMRVCMFFIPVLLLVSSRADAREHGAAAAFDARIQNLVDDLRAQLSVPQRVTVAVVPSNPLMASVEAAKGHNEGFVLSLEAGFAEALTDDELRAVVAHELGHVWIFTHHPYLQTERLANDIAMRIVPRDSLEKVYDKVWKDGIKGERSRFLADPKPAVIQVAAAPR